MAFMGERVRLWLGRCRAMRAGFPTSIYIKLYSMNPRQQNREQSSPTLSNNKSSLNDDDKPRSRRWCKIVGGQSKIHAKFEDKTLMLHPHVIQHSGCILSLWKGKPAAEISADAMLRASKPFEKSLIIKFMGCRPAFSDFQSEFLSINLPDEIRIASFRYNKALVTLSTEEAYSRLLAKRLWKFRESIARVYRCQTDFSEDLEPPTSLVWFTVSNPPLMLFDILILSAIATIFGDSLSLDSATASCSRPSQARFLVDTDLSKEIPRGIWLCGEGSDYTWLPITPDKLPSFCHFCGIVGHSQNECKRKLAGRDNGLSVSGHGPTDTLGLNEQVSPKQWVAKNKNPEATLDGSRNTCLILAGNGEATETLNPTEEPPNPQMGEASDNIQYDTGKQWVKVLDLPVAQKEKDKSVVNETEAEHSPQTDPAVYNTQMASSSENLPPIHVVEDNLNSVVLLYRNENDPAWIEKALNMLEQLDDPLFRATAEELVGRFVFSRPVEETLIKESRLSEHLMDGNDSCGDKDKDLNYRIQKSRLYHGIRIVKEKYSKSGEDWYPKAILEVKGRCKGNEFKARFLGLVRKIKEKEWTEVKRKSPRLTPKK